jgi:2-oxoglutarate dehydrogenase E2 component (dihydrolipoamide succinyltransferase)
MRRLTTLLLLPALAWAEPPADDGAESPTTIIVPGPEPVPAPEPEPAPQPAPEAAPAPTVAPEPDVQAALEELRAPETVAIEGLATEMTSQERAGLEQVRAQLVGAVPAAKDALSKAGRLVTEKKTALKVANLELKASKSEWKAAKATLKAYESDPSTGDGAQVHAVLDGAAQRVVELTRQVKVATDDLTLAKALQAHAKAVLAEDEAKLAEASARLEGKSADDLEKLLKDRVKAVKVETKAKEQVAKAKVRLERTKARR